MEPLAEFKELLQQFTNELFVFSQKHHIGVSELKAYMDNLTNFDISYVKPVIKSLNSHSKDILFRNASMFSAKLLMFDESVDMAEIWKKQTADERKVTWDYIEQLYVVGYILCYPDKKEKFLQLVATLKQQQVICADITSSDDLSSINQNSMNQSNQNSMNQNSMNQSNQPNQTDQNPMNQAVTDINSMLGLKEGDVMTEMVGDIAIHMDEMMKNTGDPQQLLTKMLAGDMSMLEGMMQSINTKIERKIETGEIDRSTLEVQAQSVLGRFQGIATNNQSNSSNSPAINPMQLLQSLGGMGGLGGLGGLGNLNNLQNMMNQFQSSQNPLQTELQTEHRPKMKKSKKNSRKNI